MSVFSYFSFFSKVLMNISPNLSIFDFMNLDSILNDISQQNFKPIYLLHGDESYYIDILDKVIVEHALEEDQRDFNQMIFYGKDADFNAVIEEAKSFPMMAERRLVVVREAQDLKMDWDRLALYAEKPNPTTVLVLEYKYNTVDKRKKAFKLIEKNGLVFQSDAIKEYNLVQWINNYLKQKNYGITAKASQLLADSIGNNLSRITNELDKLELLLTPGTQINEIHIEENIGISKEYNVFELVNAISTRDTLKAYRIVDYFAHNPKSGPLVVVISNVFTHFIRLMKIHFNKGKSPDQLAKDLRLHPFAVKQLIQSSNTYPPKIVARNIDILEEYDLKSKGIGNSSSTEAELMKEMIFKLMN